MERPINQSQRRYQGCAQEFDCSHPRHCGGAAIVSVYRRICEPVIGGVPIDFEGFLGSTQLASKPVNLLRGHRAVECGGMCTQRALQSSKFNCFPLVGGGSSVTEAVVDHCCIRCRSYRSPKRPPSPE